MNTHTTDLLSINATLSLILLGFPVAALAQVQSVETNATDGVAEASMLADEFSSTQLTVAQLMANAVAAFLAATEAAVVAQTPESTAVIAETLTIQPRFGVGYITDGGSHNSLGRFEAFVPLDQEPGETISFLEGRLVVGANDDVGGSLLLGYRGYRNAQNRIRGGYVGLDARNTGNSDFYQLGAGYESLGDDWDFRFNAYLPLGDRSNTISDTTIDTGFQVSTGFVGNQFILNSQRQQERLFQQEHALGGFDAEAGYRLMRWDAGDLQAFGGLYLYDSPDTPAYLGWRLRLASNFTPNFNGGLSLQDDGLFGTRLVLSVGATFPGTRANDSEDPVERVQARLGDPTVRSPEIAVFWDEDRETIFESNTSPLINPEEEQAYRFQHVTLGATGGDGTFENPFGTVQEGLNAAVGDGNDVVYVDGSNAINIPAFTIPERVRVLSQGPAQTIAGLPFPGFETGAVRLPFSPTTNFAEGIVVELPLSGDGNFPNITNGVTLGNRTVLAGFRIDNATGEAIVGSNIRNAELRNNTITNPGGRGIAFNNVGGSVVAFDNIIRNSAGSSIFVENTTSAQRLDLSIIGYEITASNNIGMEFVTLPTGGALGAPSQVIAVQPSDASLNTSQGNSDGETPANAITDSTNQGIVLRSEGTARNDASTQEFSFDAGSISRNGSSGVLATSNLNGGSQEISVTNSTISNNVGAGVEIVNGTTVPPNTASAQELFLRNNEILDNGGSGVDIILNALGAQEITVNANRILRNGGDGIRSIANAGLQEFPILEDGSAGITSNIISGNAEQAIDVEANGDAIIAVLNARDNTLENNSGGANVVDIDVAATSTNNSVCTVILSNTVPTGIALTTFSNNPTDRALYLVQNLNTVSFENNGTLVQLINGNTGLPEPAAFSNETNFCVP
ncbi:MAG: hypothetical protein F6K00_33220 [Leptolyngbya sp. SIOISBB]|nr:hypothetical protein [Leptolyngbya sp. SIOISBB]